MEEVAISLEQFQQLLEQLEGINESLSCVVAWSGYLDWFSGCLGVLTTVILPAVLIVGCLWWFFRQFIK